MRKENSNWNKRANKKVLCAEVVYELIVKYDKEVSKLAEEVATLNGKILFWKDGWFEQRAETGKAAWKMPPKGYGRPSNVMNIFDFKLEQPCSAEESKARAVKAKEVVKEYMAPVGKKKAQENEINVIDLFDNNIAPSKTLIKYDAWTTYLNLLRQE